MIQERPLRVLYTAFDVVPAPKGASVRIQQMWRHLAQLADPRLEVMAVVLGEPGYPAQEITPEGVNIHRLILPQASFLERTVAFAEAVLAACIDFQPDVVQFRSLWDAYPLLRWRDQSGQGFRMVYELHGLPEYELEHHFEDLAPALLAKVKAQQAAVFEAADVILAPSTVHLDYLSQQGVPSERCFQVANGVDTDHFMPAVQPSASPELLQLVYVGTLAPWQGLEHLLEALAQVPTPFQLKLVGKGQRRWVRDLLTRAFQLHVSHSVDLVGPVAYDQVPAYLQQADIAVAPLDRSDRNCVQGCMPLKILEYMACGCAIIASDLPVNRALLRHEHNALLYPAEDPVALAVALQRLAEDPALRHRLGVQARQDAVQYFSWQQGFAQMTAIYRGCVPLSVKSPL